MASYPAAPPADARSPVATFRARVLGVALGMVVLAAAMVSGFAVDEGNKPLIVLPLVAVLGLALAVLACTRFSGFVLLMLGVRASIDSLALTSTSGGSAGSTSALSRGLNPSSMLGILFLLAAMLWLAARYYSGRNVKASRLSMWLVGFWLAGLVSVAGSQHMLDGLLESLRIMTVAMMFLVLEQLITNRQMMLRVLVAAYASLLIPLGYTLFGVLSGNPASEVKSGFTRLIGTFAQSNDYARYLTFMVVFGIAIYPHLQGRYRTAMRILLILSGIFLLETLTLTAIIAAGIGILLVGIMQRRQALIISFVLVAVLGAIATPGLSTRLSSVQSQRAVGGAPTGNSLAWRFSYWTEVLPLANSNPVTGIGLDSTQYETDAAKQPHNDFLRAYVETGLIGLTMYVGMLGSLVVTCRRAVRRTARGSFDHAIAVGAFTCAVCFVVESLASNVITNVVNLWYLIAFAAAASFIGRTAARKSAAQPGEVVLAHPER